MIYCLRTNERTNATRGLWIVRTTDFYSTINATRNSKPTRRRLSLTRTREVKRTRTRGYGMPYCALCVCLPLVPYFFSVAPIDNITYLCPVNVASCCCGLVPKTKENTHMSSLQPHDLDKDISMHLFLCTIRFISKTKNNIAVTFTHAHMHSSTLQSYTFSLRGVVSLDFPIVFTLCCLEIS